MSAAAAEVGALLARADEIPRPGDLLTVALPGEPLVVSRADDGAVRCFSDLWRHRGAPIVAVTACLRRMLADGPA